MVPHYFVTIVTIFESLWRHQRSLLPVRDHFGSQIGIDDFLIAILVLVSNLLQRGNIFALLRDQVNKPVMVVHRTIASSSS